MPNINFLAYPETMQALAQIQVRTGYTRAAVIRRSILLARIVLDMEDEKQVDLFELSSEDWIAGLETRLKKLKQEFGIEDNEDFFTHSDDSGDGDSGRVAVSDSDNVVD